MKSSLEAPDKQVAAETSALTIIGVPAMAYAGNLAFLQMVIGYVIARIILAIVLVPHYFKGEIYSPYELFANTFGPAARVVCGWAFASLPRSTAGSWRRPSCARSG